MSSTGGLGKTNQYNVPSPNELITDSDMSLHSVDLYALICK